MSWAFVLLLGAGAYSLKLLGAVLVGQRTMPPVLERTLLLIPAALLAGLITKDTFTTGQDIVIDARLAGVSVAILATWRKMPLVVVIVLGVGTTAALRALS
jgi:branched-subunit amino acid transport protein